jgi:hypothetical protein
MSAATGRPRIANVVHGRLIARRYGLAGSVLLVFAFAASQYGPGTGDPGPRPAPATAVRTVPFGVSTRDDCPRVSTVEEPDCRPRIPEPLPPGGARALLGIDPMLAARVLCSAVPDDAVRHILGGPFLAYTTGRGECHLLRSTPPRPVHQIAVTTRLDQPLPDPTARPLPGTALPTSYTDVAGTTRHYSVRIGPGTLLVTCRYITLAVDNQRNIPAPQAFWAAADQYVRDLAAYLAG